VRILLVFGADWRLGWGRSQNLTRALARLGHEVHYINPIKPLWGPGLGAFWRSPTRAEPGIWVHPDTAGLPYVRYPWTLKPTVWMQRLLQRHALASHQRWDLLIFYGVPPGDILDLFLRKAQASVRIYDCADDKVESARDLLSPAAARKVEAWEAKLVDAVDGVTAINAQNLERLARGRPLPQRVITNGVDLELFRPVDGVPRNARSGVYVGTLNDRLDVDRLLRVFHSAEDTHEFHFYGHMEPVVERLRSASNFVYHDYVHYRELPGVLSRHGFGLLPYRDLVSIRRSDPLKTLQYWASGLPALAFRWGSQQTFGGRLQVLEGDTLPDELRPPPDRAFLEGHSWIDRARRLVDFVRDLSSRVGRQLPSE
jgi:glycosyltransferase involved in cell wall biosynthesis